MRRVASVSLALVVALTAPAAAAQTSDHERAEAHFEVARRHVRAGHCDLAIEQLRIAIDYEPTSVGARLNLGDCFVTLGRYPEAFRQYKEAEANAVQRNDPRVETARRSGAEIQAKLVRVLLREPDPVVAGLVVTVDGASAGTRPWLIAVTPRAQHVIEASAPGGRRWRTEVNGNPGDMVRFDIELGAAAVEAGPRAADGDGRSSASPVRTVGFVVGTVGIASLASGIVFGALASSSRSDLADAVRTDPQCSGAYPDARCQPGAQARLGPIEDRAFLQSTVSTASFIAGGALLAGGLLMVVLAPSSSPPANNAGVGRIRIRMGASGGLEGTF
jgi:hypothetical protein